MILFAYCNDVSTIWLEDKSSKFGESGGVTTTLFLVGDDIIDMLEESIVDALLLAVPTLPLTLTSSPCEGRLLDARDFLILFIIFSPPNKTVDLLEKG
jgi:hypothetical protein